MGDANYLDGIMWVAAFDATQDNAKLKEVAALNTVRLLGFLFGVDPEVVAVGVMDARRSFSSLQELDQAVLDQLAKELLEYERG